VKHDQDELDDASGYDNLFAGEDKSHDTQQFWRTMNAIFWALMLALLVAFWTWVGKDNDADAKHADRRPADVVVLLEQR